MTITDWSAAGADQIAALYADETRRWHAAFDWDTTPQWREVEQARARWGLPGFIARDPRGRVSGWLYYLTTPDGAQLGGVSADDAGTACALVRHFAARVGGARVTGFMPALTPGLDAALDQAGFDVTPHLYLTRSLLQGAAEGTRASDAGSAGARAVRGVSSTPAGDLVRTRSRSLSHARAEPAVATQYHVRLASSSEATMRGWREGDIPLAARVLQDAYDPSDASLFAPAGTGDAWRTYVTSLVEQIGCGRFLAAASVMAEVGGDVVGTAIVTRLSDRMAHLAQIGVIRGRQGSGDGARLLGAAMSASAESGADAMSLLVSSRNAGAVRFYGRMGFSVRGRFLELVGARRAARPLSLCG